MKAVIYLSVSKRKRSRTIATSIDGDIYQLLPGESIPSFPLFKLFKLGHMTVTDKVVPFSIPKIDYDKYTDIVLVFPIWAGRMAQYMKCYLDTEPFKNKNITLIASSGGGNKRYLKKLQEIELENNKITDIVLYKGTQIIG